jgi:hypothetical protein
MSDWVTRFFERAVRDYTAPGAGQVIRPLLVCLGASP